MVLVLNSEDLLLFANVVVFGAIIIGYIYLLYRQERTAKALETKMSRSMNRVELMMNQFEAIVASASKGDSAGLMGVIQQVLPGLTAGLQGKLPQLPVPEGTSPAPLPAMSPAKQKLAQYSQLQIANASDEEAEAMVKQIEAQAEAKT